MCQSVLPPSIDPNTRLYPLSWQENHHLFSFAPSTPVISRVQTAEAVLVLVTITINPPKPLKLFSLRNTIIGEEAYRWTGLNMAAACYGSLLDDGGDLSH